MASIDIESLLTPVSDDQPAGEDLEYDSTYVEMEKAAAGKPDQVMGDEVIEGEEPDWKSVQRDAIELLGRTKDLRVCIFLCQSALRMESIEGLSAALKLTSQMTEAFWPTMFPELDEDDDNDPTARVNAIMSLATPAILLNPIEKAPLLSIPMLGSVSYADVKPEAGEEEPKEASSEVQAIINNCELDQIASRRDALTAAIEASTALEAFVTDQVGASNAPNLKPLRDLLQRILKQLNRWWDQRGGNASDEQDAADDDEEASGAEGNSSASVRSGGGHRGRGRSGGGSAIPDTITSRQEVIACIDKILAYYQRYEPSSPLPLLLDRAKRLATKSFLEILQDLIPEGLDSAQSIGGIAKGSVLASSVASAESSSDFSYDDSIDDDSSDDRSDDSSDDDDDDFFS